MFVFRTDVSTIYHVLSFRNQQKDSIFWRNKVLTCLIKDVRPKVFIHQEESQMHVHPIFLKFNFLMVSPKYSTNCNFKLSLHIHLSWTCIPILVQALRKHHKELRTGTITFIVVRKSLYNQEAHFSEVGRVSNSYI